MWLEIVPGEIQRLQRAIGFHVGDDERHGCGRDPHLDQAQRLQTGRLISQEPEQLVDYDWIRPQFHEFQLDQIVWITLQEQRLQRDHRILI